MPVRDLCLITLILLLGLALRAAYLTVDRFHADEALYAGWALRILDGDPLLQDVPVDKPPLYLYTLAGSLAIWGHSEVAARLPGLSASLVGIALVHRLGRRLYSPLVGIWAALFLALSPFDILFARTAFTDSMLVAWMLAALNAIVDRRWFLAGLWTGLAFATKQHALLLVPLLLATGLVQVISATRDKRSDARRSSDARRVGRAALQSVLGFVLPFLGVLAWDAARWKTRPSYWQQSALSYGGLLWAPVSQWGKRLLEWTGWSRYLVGSRSLAVLTCLGCLSLLALGWLQRSNKRETWLDTLWMAFLFVYLAAHTVLQFSIWDRYLLPLAPLVALLLARAVAQFEPMIQSLGLSCRSSPLKLCARCLIRWGPILISGLFLFLALFSGLAAARNGYPVGGDHWAYQGLDEIVAYLKANAPPNAVLYHHWLRWHYSYYLYNTTLELRWWESGDHMQREVLRTPDRVQYVVLPDWRTLDPDAPGLQFELLYQARRKDSSVSFSLYQVSPRPASSLPGKVL